jgi:hypothetical protein
MQVQDLSNNDLKQIEGLNLQGTKRTIFVKGFINGLIRATNDGGDIVTLQDGTVWIVSIATESWPDWCKVVVTLQDGS